MFMGANTADGFVSFYDQIVDWYDIKKMYILKGGSGVGKSTFIKKFTERVIANVGVAPKSDPQTLTIDFIMCSFDPNSYDGVIIHELGLAIIDGTLPHIVDPKYPGLVEEIIDLSKYINPNAVGVDRWATRDLKQQKSELFKSAYKTLNDAMAVHMQLEVVYKDAVDFKKVDKLISHIVSKI